MDGYSEIGKIYFMVSDRTSFAELLADGTIITGSYQGAPPYKALKGKSSQALNEYHAAEHKVYNCFIKKIKHLPEDTNLEDFASYVPTLQEARKTPAFSFLCGTTVFLSSALLLFGAALPNIFKFHNTSLLFMSFWFFGVISFALVLSKWVQHRFFLAEPDDQQIQLAIEALKETFRNGTNS